MESFMNYVTENASWIFSGVGVLALSGLAWFVKTCFNKSSNSQTQKTGGGSTGYQAGGNITFGKEKNDD